MVKNPFLYPRNDNHFLHAMEKLPLTSLFTPQSGALNPEGIHFQAGISYTTHKAVPLAYSQHEVIERLVINVHQGFFHGQGKVCKIRQVLPALLF